MPTDKTNVILLTVDAFRADRTSLHGYRRPTTPTLERLAKNAIVCDHAFSLGTFTQSACIQILTSSRPLSYGGYDHGARGRPPTLFKRFHEAGYRTTCLSTLHWVNRFFGYGDGVDEEYQLFGLNTLPGVALAMIRSSLSGYQSGEISEDSMFSTVEPVLLRLFDNTLEYCALNRQRRLELSADFPDSALVNARYDYAKVEKLIDRHRSEFLADKVAYVRKHLQPPSLPADWMGRWLPREWYYYREPSKLLSKGLHEVGHRILAPFNAKSARGRKNRFKIYPDARSLADKVISLMGERDRSRPFFIWTHFMDTHAPYVSGPGRKWYRHTPEYLAALGYPRDLDPSIPFDGKPQREEDKTAFSALYDAALRSTDEEIGRIIDALDRLGLRDNTLVVVAGDHGEELGEHGDYGHFFRLYDHNSRVPMLFHHPRLDEQRIGGLTTILDMAPTIATLAGIEPAPGWEGRAVTAPEVATRRYVLSETFFGGNCLFEHRPLYMGVRTKEYLYLWKEFRDPNDSFSPEGCELYDVNADPDQKTNIFRSDHPIIPEFNTLIAKRLAEIPEVRPERIARAFGAEATEAAAKAIDEEMRAHAAD